MRGPGSLEGDLGTNHTKNLEAVKRYYEKNGLIPEIQAGLLSDKTLNFLLEKSSHQSISKHV